MAGPKTIGVTAGSAFDLSIEKDVFADMDVELRAVDVSSVDDLKSSLNGVDAVIDRLLAAPYTADVIDSLDRCQVIARCGIGVDAIDTDRAAERGMYVVNVPVYCQDEVSEHALLLMLALQRNLVDYDSGLKDGVWAQDVTGGDIHRIRGQTLGLVGFGTIARLVAEKARAFGMDVIASDPYIDAAEMEEEGVEKVSFETALDRADVLSLHAPLIDETEGLIDAEALERMDESAYLINVARGELVVESALVDALQKETIAGAGLDVFRHEPSGQTDGYPSFDNPLRDLDSVVLTPHVAWFSQEANAERRRKAALDVRRVLEGTRPENPVNDPR